MNRIPPISLRIEKDIDTIFIYVDNTHLIKTALYLDINSVIYHYFAKLLLLQFLQLNIKL